MRWLRTGVLLFGLVQAALAVRVLRRMLESGGPAIEPDRPPPEPAITVVVPVLNEVSRLGPCLDGLLAQDQIVREILVVDGGSTDGTQRLVEAAVRRDSRVRLIDASPVPDTWNGKAWGLQVGLEAACTETAWLLTVDADVRPRPTLVAGLVARAEADQVATASLATRQETAGLALGLLHPACLTTLVYRLGRPGRLARWPAHVQANGQCQLFARAALAEIGGFTPVRASRCEDVTIARALVANGGLAGFYDTTGASEAGGWDGGLVSVRMYEHWREAWGGWTRSLPLRDRYTRWSGLLGLAEVTLIQAAPLPLAVTLVLGMVRTHRMQHAWPLLALNVLLVLVRVGVLFGTRRAYTSPPWTYWLSPLADFPVTVRLWSSILRRRHTWRGRPLVMGAHT
jgi:dolichol-phosphate mannosyltransferase